MSHITGLTIRQHGRNAIELPIEFVVSDEHTGQVRLSSGGSTMHEQAITGLAVDISAGGMGLITDHYVPRMCEGIVRVLGPISDVPLQDPALRDIVFEHQVKVRRTSMASHKPAYSIGVSVLEPQADLAERIKSLMITFGSSELETPNA